MPGIVRDLDIDVAKHRLYAGGEMTPFGGGQAFFVIDISNLQLTGLIDNDGDLNGWDDRILWHTTYASGINGFRIDNERGVAYVATIQGLDVLAVGDICCDLGVDLTPKRTEGEHGDRDRLLKEERQAIQTGVAAGLVQASAACSVDPFDGRVTILEQGSGACIWRGNCDQNYQPGLSDHDFEVFVPTSYFGLAPIHRPGRDPETPPQCVTNVINEQFTDPDTQDPIVFTTTAIAFRLTTSPSSRCGRKALRRQTWTFCRRPRRAATPQATWASGASSCFSNGSSRVRISRFPRR